MTGSRSSRAPDVAGDKPCKQERRNRSILFVINSLDIGGSERHVVRLARSMVRDGWEACVYCLNWTGVLADDLRADGVAVSGPLIDVPTAALWRPDVCGALLLSAGKLFWTMARLRPSLVQFFLPASYLIGAPLSLALPVGVRVMSRRSLNNYQERRPFARWLEPLLHRRMSAIVSNSGAAATQLIEEEGCPAAQVHLIYNGIDAAAYPARSVSKQREIRASLGLKQDSLVTLTVANLLPYKGHADLIQALAGVRDQLPANWCHLCVGKDLGLLKQLRGMVETLGLSDHILFAGPQHNVTDYLYAADFGVLPSYEEGFSNFSLEAMAAGLPMVLTNVGGNPEAVIDGETGLIVPPRDPTALGQAVARLASEAAMVKRMSAAARERARREFSLDRCVIEHEKLYARLLKG